MALLDSKTLYDAKCLRSAMKVHMYGHTLRLGESGRGREGEGGGGRGREEKHASKTHQRHRKGRLFASLPPLEYIKHM